jgi:D-glucuronyl C5-epimerase C-terminus
MPMGALSGLGAVTLALTASAPPLSPAPPPAPKPVVSRAPAHTVSAAIDRAEALGAISAGRAATYRLQWHDAFAAQRKLTGWRRGLVLQAVSSTQRLAASGRLRAGRLASAIAAAHASARFAKTGRALPGPGGRISVPGDNAVYSYRPPYGMQFHPLGTIGKLNALATTCTEVGRKRGWRCRRRTLAAAADRLVELAVPAGPTLRFEYLFGFGGGAPGWISAMTQGTGAQALARTSAITGRARYAGHARAAYRALTRPAPRGAAVRGGDGLIAHLAMYSFNPSMRVLNGEEQSLIGIADYARITGDEPAAKLARRGARELATHLGQFDTGAWTLYDLGGAEADLNYHRLAARFAKGVCTRALARGFCPAAARFARYTTEAPRLGLAVPAQIRAPQRLTIALAASKQTSARLIVSDAKGHVVFARTLALGRFGTRFVVPVRRAGAYSVSLAARAINGRSARMSRTLIARPPKPKPKPKPKPRKATKQAGASGTGTVTAKPKRVATPEQAAAKPKKSAAPAAPASTSGS